MRVDELMEQRGFVSCRSQARALVLSGAVWIGEDRIDKAGTWVRSDANLSVRSMQPSYVSRGGGTGKGGRESMFYTLLL